jgi:hypothetical protein
MPCQSPTIILKRLHVHADSRGELQPGRAPTEPRPVGDEWWRDVLYHRRANLPVQETRFSADSQFANYRLDRQHGDKVMIGCRCGRGGVFDKASLIGQMGADANVLWLARSSSNAATAQGDKQLRGVSDQVMPWKSGLITPDGRLARR